jgi:16S rRNA (uracil1498-N3)-methyltransferase
VNLILLEPGEVREGLATFSGARAAHVAGVLHAQPGQRIRLGIVDGPLGFGVISSLDPDRVIAECAFDAGLPPKPPIDLLLALPRPKIMRRLWAQLAALGVGRILLTNAERVERNYFDTHVLDPATYRPLLIEGLQQVRDTRLPEVSVHRQLKVLVEDHLDAVTGDAGRLVAHPGSAASISETTARTRARRWLLAVGPEGGWNQYEIDLLQAHRFQLVAIGERTLRADTACIALLSVLSSSATLAAGPR